MNFGFVPPHAYLHDAGVWSKDCVYVHDYELLELTFEQRLEFNHLLHVLSNTPGVAVSYEPKMHRYCIYFPTPIITTMDDNRVEYPDAEA